MTGNHREDAAAPLVASLVNVRVTDAAVLNLDEDIAGSDFVEKSKRSDGFFGFAHAPYALVVIMLTRVLPDTACRKTFVLHAVRAEFPFGHVRESLRRRYLGFRDRA